MSDEIKPEQRTDLGELRKLRAVCIFAGGAAHDYNNALTAVMGNISLAKLEAEGNPELTELLIDAEKAAVRIKVMTESIALYTRGIKINRQRSSVVDVVREALEASTGNYPGTSRLDVTENIPGIDIDPALIREALACILENACEAAPSQDGVIEVSVSREDLRDSSAYYGDSVPDGDYIKIAVRDNGAGFNPEDSTIIFDPYYSTKSGREGIGLALAYSILRRHRGFITASLPEDGGSLFSVFIPFF